MVNMQGEEDKEHYTQYDYEINHSKQFQIWG